MTTHTAAPAPTFTPAEQQALGALRARYLLDRDLFTDAERARLRFLRWLVQTARLVP